MRHARREGGFVLVLVLAMLVVLGLLAGSIAAVTARLLEQAQQRERAMQDEVDMASTRATVFYLLSTQRVTVGGVTVDNLASFGEDGIRAIGSPAELDGDASLRPVGTEIALDGRAYRGIGKANFAMQDDNGLFGVNWNPPARLERLLAQGGQPRPVPAEALFNRIMDYQDRDNLYRLNSMEADGYLSAGMAPPTNLPLATPMELLRVSGWDQALSFLKPIEISDTLTVEPISVLNVNTAPARVLRTLSGVDEEKAARAIAWRKLQPFLTDTAFFQFLGLPPTLEAPIAVYPARSGTLKLWPSLGGQVRLVHWRLTPSEDRGRPWREDYELIQSRGPSQPDAAYPVRSRLFREPVAARQ
jgi:general secretion pathway protein K